MTFSPKLTSRIATALRRAFIGAFGATFICGNFVTGVLAAGVTQQRTGKSAAVALAADAGADRSSHVAKVGRNQGKPNVVDNSGEKGRLHHGGRLADDNDSQRNQPDSGTNPLRSSETRV